MSDTKISESMKAAEALAGSEATLSADPKIKQKAMAVDGNSTPLSSGERSVIENDNIVADEKAAVPEEDEAMQTIAQRPKPLVFFSAWAAILACAFLYGLDTTIAADVQASIYESLGAVDKIAWVGIGFPLGSAGTILPVGMAFGKFDLKIFFCAGLVLFEAGSALCGGAPTMEALIWGRVIAGIGGCIMYLGALNFATVYTTIKQRSVYTAVIGIFWALGTILGPVIGGAFATSSATWRWAFYINLCLFAIIGPITLFLMPSYNPRPDLTVMGKLAKTDWVGSTLIAGVITTFILAFSLAGSQWAWSDGRWIAMIVVFCILLIAFVIQQWKALFTSREEQIFPVWFLKRRTLVLLYIAMSASSSAFFMAIYYIPLYYQFAHSDSAMKAAIRLLPFICVAITFVMLQGALLPVVGYYWPWYAVSGVFTLIGGCVMHTVDASTPISRVYGYSIIMAIGNGLIAQGGYPLAAAKAKNAHEVGHSIGFMNIAQIGSVAVALCTSGQVYQSVSFSNLKSAMAGSGYTEAQIRDIIAGTKSTIFQSASPEVKAAAIKAITDAIDDVYIQAIACGAIVIVCSILMKKERLNLQPGAPAAA